MTTHATFLHLEHRAPSRPEATLEKARRLVSEETGVIRLLYEAPLRPDAPRVFGCGSLCSDFSELGFPSENSISGSTSLDRNQAIAGAIGEAVERYSAAYVPYEDIKMHTCAAVSEDALTPSSLTLYDEEQYKCADFPYEPLPIDRKIGWVKGHSLVHERSVLVPAFGVYQPYQSICGEPPVIQQITTGLACGNTLEEAILSAICEIVERDASMLMWMKQISPPHVQIDVQNTLDRLPVLGRFGELARYLTLLDVTTDIAIPAYVAVWDGPIAGEHGAIFASCAKLSPSRAAEGALTELAQCLMWADSLVDGGEKLPDPSRSTLSRIEEHVLWPLAPTARSHYAFTLASSERRSFDEREEPASKDVLHSIKDCVSKIAAVGLDVIVVDVTSPDIRDCGLHVVRVLVPGAQPLFFGSGMHRVSERAHCGNSDSDGTTINLHPHPFP